MNNLQKGAKIIVGSWQPFYKTVLFHSQVKFFGIYSGAE